MLCLPSLPRPPPDFIFLFFNAPATTAIYTLSLHDALPIFEAARAPLACVRVAGRRWGREPGRRRAARVGRLVAGARERVPQTERSAPPRRARDGEDELLRVRLKIGAHEQHVAELGMDA